MSETKPEPYQPSGLNNGFYFSELSFSEYIQMMRTIIKKTRILVHGGQDELVLNANSPFEWIPTNKEAMHPQTGKINNGILLIHGLFDSPNTMLSMAEHFKARNYLVRAILLPGHGTVPGDLLHIDYREWIKAVEYGIASFTNEVENLYLCGFSTGAILALQQAFVNRSSLIKALILFAPAIKLKSHLSIITYLNRLMKKTIGGTEWFIKSDNHDYAKYTSFTTNSSHQVHQLANEVAVLHKQHQLSLPLYLVITEDDEVIAPEGVISFFRKTPNAHNHLRIYTTKFAEKEPSEDIRIEYINSYLQEKNIINFSHVCIPIAPNHSHYGVHGDYQEVLQHMMSNNYHPKKDPEIFLGALLKESLQQYTLKRLTYNPDYANMMRDIDWFIRSLPNT